MSDKQYVSIIKSLKEGDRIFVFFCKVTQPFELIGMDLIGKLVQTDWGNQYVCVMMTDYLTKWPQAYALLNKSAKACKMSD